MTKYKSHPAADLFPMMQGSDFDELVADIKENGQREPIILLDYLVLDGRNRDAACEKLGIKPKVINYPVGDEEIGDPVRYVISKNLHRRHLDTGQRASIAAKLANMQQGQRTDLEPSAKMQKVSQTKSAEMMNVSPRSVADAKTVHDHGSPELNAALDAGEVKVSTAAEMSKTQTHAEQRETLEEMKAREQRQKEETKEKREKLKEAGGKPKKGTQQSKGKSYVPKGQTVERKDEADKGLGKRLDPLFLKLWQCGADVRNMADAIERILIDGGIIPKSERQLDPKAYLARLKPQKRAVDEPDEAKAPDADERTVP